MIELIDVSKNFVTDNNLHIKAIRNINLKVEKKQIVGIIGHSGAGKSTLLRCINLLEIPTEGKVIVNGDDLTTLNKRELMQKRKNMGMIFQHFNLMTQRNVFKNVLYPLKNSKMDKEMQHKRVLELLKIVGLEEKANSYPSELSGGQKQRVAIARALANNPDILLCDEITSALDPQSTKSILSLLKSLRDKLDLTIVLITHEIEVVKEICDYVVVLDNGEIVEQNNIIDIFKNPKHNKTRELINSSTNFNKFDELLKENMNFFGDLSNGMLAKVKYVGETVKKAILSEASRKYNVDISVLFGNLDLIKNVPFGELIVKFDGTINDINEAINYFINNNIEVEIIKGEC